MAGMLARIGDFIRGEVAEGQLVDRVAPNLPSTQRRQLIRTQKRGTQFVGAFNRVRRMDSGFHRRERASLLGSSSSMAMDLALVRDEAVAVARVNPHARNGMRVLVNWTVGDGFNMTVKARNKTIQRRADETYKRWFLTRECDATRHQNFYGITRLVAKIMYEQGEVLVRLRPRRMQDGLAVPLAIEVIDPVMLYDGGITPKIEPGNRFSMGIEFSPLNHPVAYWLYRGNPNDNLLNRTPIRVPVVDPDTGMRQIVHLFDKEFGFHIRGIPRASIVLKTIYEQQDLRYSILRRKRMEAKIGLIIKAPDKDKDDGSPAPLADVIERDGEYSLDTPANDGPFEGEDTGDRPFTFEDADELAEWIRDGMLEDNMVIPMPAGFDTDSVVIQNVADYKEFMADLHRTIGVGLGVPYAFLTEDLTDVPFSGSKVGLLSFKSARQNDQQYLIDEFCHFVWEGFDQAARMAGLWSFGDVTCHFRANQFPSVEPQKDLGVIVLMMKHSMISPRRAAAMMGEDFDEILAEIEEDKSKLEALGIDLYGSLKLAAAAAGRASANGGSGSSAPAA